MKRVCDRRGLTLIEMLVVIGIIAVLASLLFPMVDGAMEKARRATCLNNVKQIGIAGASYLEDLHNELPVVEKWSKFGHRAEQLLPYVRNNRDIFRCPSFDPSTTRDVWFRFELPSYPGELIDYEFNGLLSRSPAVLGKGGDSESKAVIRYQSKITDYSEAALVYDSFYWVAAKRAHEGGVNVGYLDGHAAWLPESAYGQIAHEKSDATTFFNKGHLFWLE